MAKTWIVAVLVVPVSALIIIGIMTFGGLGIFKFSEPIRQDIRREVFEGTKSFNDGMARDLSNLRLEYLSAEEGAHRTALRNTILHRANDIDEDRLPADLRTFVRNLRTGG